MSDNTQNNQGPQPLGATPQDDADRVRVYLISNTFLTVEASFLLHRSASSASRSSKSSNPNRPTLQVPRHRGARRLQVQVLPHLQGR